VLFVALGLAASRRQTITSQRNVIRHHPMRGQVGQSQAQGSPQAGFAGAKASSVSRDGMFRQIVGECIAARIWVGYLIRCITSARLEYGPVNATCPKKGALLQPALNMAL
jgi:hypothetical protein